jgi:integrase
MNHRAVQPGARKHDFLFVSEDNGAPLSISSLTKIFLILRTKCPDLPRDLSAHVLRHTWNDRYSETMDKRQVAEESEKKMRSYLMGWSETSGTAAIYTRRHIRKRAQEASLAMQERLFRQEKERE